MNVIRGGLLFLFAFAVLAFGAVEVWSGSILEIGASLLFIGWAALVCLDDGIKIYWNPLNWPLLGLFGIGSTAVPARHALSFFDASRTVKARRVSDDFFSGDTGLSRAPRSDDPRMVSDPLVFLSVAAGHRAALHLRF